MIISEQHADNSYAKKACMEQVFH